MVFVRHAGRSRWRVALTTVSLVALAVGLSAAGHALAPQPPRFFERTPSATRQSAVVAGQVTDAETGAPIGQAVVVLTDASRGWQKVGVTDSDGHYEVSGLAAAAYELRASAIGYVGRRYGQRFALDAGALVELLDGDLVEEADFALRRGGTLSGQVVDAAGNPMEFAEVEALRPQLQGNQRVLVPIGVAQSNARGEFRLGGLPPGSYYVGAFDPATETIVDASGEPTWPHTFYPGVIAAVDAERVPLLASGEVQNIDIAIQSIPRVRVRGNVLTPANADLRSGAVTLSPESRGGVNLGPSLAATVNPDGRFEFAQVPPGTYRIRAQASDASALAPLFGTFLVTVESRDLTNLNLSLNRGTRLGGQVELVPSAGTPVPPDLSSIWISAPMADGTLSWGVTTTRVDRDGRFLFDSPEGARVIRPSQLPPPWTLDRVLHLGRDVTDNPLDFAQGDSYTNVRVILTDRSSRLTGLVTDADGEPVSDRAVVALSANPLLRRPGSRHMRLVYPGLNGRYDITGLPNGTYLVAVVEELYAGELYEREVFDAIAAAGTATRVAAGETTTLDLAIEAGTERLANK